MKKILYIITQSEFGGAQRYCFDLANNLKQEFSVCLAASGQDELVERLEDAEIKYFGIPHLKRSLSPINDILALIEIIKLIKKEKPDIIHLNSSKISILGSIAGWICKKLKIINPKAKIIYTAHGWVFNEPMPQWQKIFYKHAEKITASMKDKIICVSEFDLQIAKKENISGEEKLIAIHNGLGSINFLDKKDARNVLNKFIKDDSLLLVGALGNLYKTKGYEYLVEAGNILINKFKLPINILIIGKGEEKRNILNLIEKYKLEKNFILAGGIRNASKLLPGIDILVSSSVKEGFPYSILEAMSAGLPIVTTKVGGIPEMIQDKKNGLLVSPANAEELAEAIEKIVENKKLSECLGLQAKRDVTEKFSIQNMIEKTKDTYLE